MAQIHADGTEEIDMTDEGEGEGESGGGINKKQSMVAPLAAPPFEVRDKPGKSLGLLTKHKAHLHSTITSRQPCTGCLPLSARAFASSVYLQNAKHLLTASVLFLVLHSRSRPPKTSLSTVSENAPL